MKDCYVTFQNSQDVGGEDVFICLKKTEEKYINSDDNYLARKRFFFLINWKLYVTVLFCYSEPSGEQVSDSEDEFDEETGRFKVSQRNVDKNGRNLNLERV